MGAIGLLLVGIGATALIAFFAWLATNVVAIRENVASMTVNITSLLGTRETQAKEEAADTKQRLATLEGQQP